MTFFFLVCSLFQLASTQAPALPVKAIVARMESAYRSSRTLEATFLERYTESGKQVRAESGNAYFQRPGKMRFEYAAPEKNLFVVDGKFAWFYVPADRTVTRVPAKQSSDWRTPLALLAGDMKIFRVCSKVELSASEKPQSPGSVVLHCNLKGEDRAASSATKPAVSAPDDSQTVFFEVVRDTGELTRILVRQGAGVEIEFRFADWKFNPPIDDSRFHFTPPMGVAIVNGEFPSDVSTVKQ